MTVRDLIRQLLLCCDLEDKVEMDLATDPKKLETVEVDIATSAAKPDCVVFRSKEIMYKERNGK